jgi:maltose phosphorylase
MLDAQKQKWAEIWKLADIIIEGDDEAQQGIRFNIFHLNQTYTGEDARLNIGPKGFTGEKYGGSTYWDTEAYCLPFYMSTKDQHVARQLLKYRYNQLDRAIENAAKLGFKNGAALYPMVTMNGEECHNEWEITFEEIHRNGAIAYAIYNYVKYTGDESVLAEFGIDVLIGISRFWAQRVHWSKAKELYVMHGVTGPNEYENNINNNWYTSYFAAWTLKYCSEAIEKLRVSHSDILKKKFAALHFDEKEELAKWKHIIEKMYFGKLEGTKIYLQQDGFMDKELMSAADLNPAERPINQHWSWDRILRSCFIKQADVLAGIVFLRRSF